jgi:phospholipase D1/2
VDPQISDGMEPVGRVPSETGDMDAAKDAGDHEREPKEVDEKLGFGQSLGSNNGAGQGDGASARASYEDKPAEKGKTQKGKGNEVPPFTKQEKEEMEALLGELCGHLGESRCILVGHGEADGAMQWFTRRDSWRARTLRTTSCSIATG